MSLIPHGFFPRSAFDMDRWIDPVQHAGGHNTMDLFDAFDELDHMMSRNLQWLARPQFETQLQQPIVPQKYRITLDCVGYSPASISTDVKGNKLTVTGKEETKDEHGDFHVKEFKKTYALPAHAETNKLASFMTRNGQLVIEMPLKEIAKHSNDDLFPRVVDVPATGGKQVQMKFHVPETIDPSKLHVSVKNRDLIVKAEDKVEKPDGVSRFYYYKRTTMPENTDFAALKCNFNPDHSINIDAPIDLNFKHGHRTIPIEVKPAITQK